MDKIRNAAIILIGLGEKNSAEILKNMSPKEVRAILEAVNTIENVTEDDVLRALNDFFRESNNNIGLDFTSKEQVKNSILMAVGNKGLGALIQGLDGEKDRWLELLKAQPAGVLADLIQDEHPQILTALVIIIFNYISSEFGTKVIKILPKPLQNTIFRRMSSMGAMANYGLSVLAEFFEAELDDSQEHNVITFDGLEAVANIISYLDTETEHEIMSDISNEDKTIGEQIQDKIFPFHRLAELDKKSMQVLLKEIKNEDLILALKGVDDGIKEVFFVNMSSKSAEILKDEMETKGPVKLATVLDAQKRIIRLAKKLGEEEKIILSAKNDPNVVY